LTFKVRYGSERNVKKFFGIGSVRNLTNYVERFGIGSESKFGCAIWVTKLRNTVKFVCCGWWFSTEQSMH